MKLENWRLSCQKIESTGDSRQGDQLALPAEEDLLFLFSDKAGPLSKDGGLQGVVCPVRLAHIYYGSNRVCKPMLPTCLPSMPLPQHLI